MNVWEVHVKAGSSTVTVSFDGTEYELEPGEASRMGASMVSAAQHAAINKERYE
mgnify:CR=1 FL=1